MSEYPIGLNGEMIHCLAEDEYSRFCIRKLEREVKEAELKQEISKLIKDKKQNGDEK